MTYTYSLPTPLGSVLLASDGENLTGLWFEGQKYFAAGSSAPESRPDLPVFGQVEQWLREYFSGSVPAFVPPLAPIGSTFRHAVWDVLLTVPYGQTVTYGGIAETLRSRGIKSSAQAVGGAVGHNPISLIIPCHRVLGSDGSLTGYAAGTDRKEALLRLEGMLR